MSTPLELLYENLTGNLLGSEKASKLLMTGLLADGHVLIQGPPGMGKTSLAKTLAKSVNADFRRIQFTPDLLPADILGYNIYDQASTKFIFHKGPIFSNIILADEINRASPRTQSALLESMNESQVSMDGQTYPLSTPFFVVATENHLASAGTFPLPDSQLDRFILSFSMPEPDSETQVKILELHSKDDPLQDIPGVITREELVRMIDMVRKIYVDRKVMEYIVALRQAIHQRREFLTGTSSRASIALMNAARARAFMHGRDVVYPDDIKRVMPYVFRHRLVLKAGEDRTTNHAEDILMEIVESVSVPMGA